MAPSLHDRSSEYGRGGGAVASDIRGLGRDFTHHLRAHILELIGQLDLLGDRHTVLGDARGTERFIEHDVAALGAERHLHRIVENVDPAQHTVAGIDRKFDVLSSHFVFL